MTPPWIQEYIDANDGWFFNQKATDTSPVVLEAWCCVYCKVPLQANDNFVLMPMTTLEDVAWSASHTVCVMNTILGD